MPRQEWSVILRTQAFKRGVQLQLGWAATGTMIGVHNKSQRLCSPPHGLRAESSAAVEHDGRRVLALTVGCCLSVRAAFLSFPPITCTHTKRFSAQMGDSV